MKFDCDKRYGELLYYLFNLVFKMNVINWIKVGRFFIIDILYGKEGNELLELYVLLRIFYFYMDIFVL